MKSQDIYLHQHIFFSLPIATLIIVYESYAQVVMVTQSCSTQQREKERRWRERGREREKGRERDRESESNRESGRESNRERE